jgi:hypothetical protein
VPCKKQDKKLKKTHKEEKKHTEDNKKISSDSLRYFHFRFHFPLIASSFPMSYAEDREEKKKKIKRRGREDKRI